MRARSHLGRFRERRREGCPRENEPWQAGHRERAQPYWFAGLRGGQHRLGQHRVLSASSGNQGTAAGVSADERPATHVKGHQVLVAVVRRSRPDNCVSASRMARCSRRPSRRPWRTWFRRRSKQSGSRCAPTSATPVDRRLSGCYPSASRQVAFHCAFSGAGRADLQSDVSAEGSPTGCPHRVRWRRQR